MRRTRACGCAATTNGGSSRPITTASISSRRRSATSRARPRSSRCACRSARRPCSSPSSAKACSRSRWSTLDGKSPVIEVPMIGTYGPNVFVSALAVRGRVDPEVPGPYAWLKRIVLSRRLLAAARGRGAGRARYAPDRARRSDQARLQARHGRDQGRAARVRAQREGHARSRDVPGARDGARRHRR